MYIYIYIYIYIIEILKYIITKYGKITNYLLLWVVSCIKKVLDVHSQVNGANHVFPEEHPGPRHRYESKHFHEKV